MMTGYKVYWTDKTGRECSLYKSDLEEAQTWARYARDAGGTFVCIAHF
jgi:hypothetical protein